ncbi:MAG: fasciclin domain-containing protein [Chloroflexota bacterium]
MKISMKTTYTILAILLMAVLSGCGMAAVETPDRPIEITVEDALAAQETLMGALATGSATLTEAEFSSFLTKLLEANSGPNQPVESIMAWIEPDALHMRATLKEGVMMAGAGSTLDLVGNLAIVDGQLNVELIQVASGAFSASGPLLTPIAAQINGALSQQLPPLPLGITQDTGVLTIGLGAAGAASDDMPAEEAEADTIAGIVVAASQADEPEFTSLLAAVEVAGFATLLSQEGPFTVFAPTDDAFAALPEGMLDRLLSSVISTQAVLQYHVLDGKVMAADVVALDGQAAPTLFGAPLAISVDGDAVMINGEVQVIQMDIEASNGVIHVIDTVLIPERP